MPGRRAWCDEHDPLLLTVSYGVSYRSAVPFTGPHALTGLNDEALAVDGAEVDGVDDAGGAGLQPAVPLQMEGMKGRSQDVECDLSPKRAPTVGLVQSGIPLLALRMWLTSMRPRRWSRASRG